MLSALRATLDPGRYHGEGRARPFFEGWYYKVVDRAEDHRYAIIPGLFRGLEAAQDHAFIQVLDGATGGSVYVPYPSEAFRSSPKGFDIAIGANRFTARQIALDLESPDCTLRGSLSFPDTKPWPVSLASPGIMGWYAWVPFMECYHGVLSLDHAIEGRLNISGEAVNFGGGRGYIEKDWGRAFPAAWVWCQTNHFGQPGTSLTASVAIIPWLRGAFPGFIVGLWHEGVLYRFATYGGARLEHLMVGDEQITWVVRDKRYRLEMALARSSGSLVRAPDRVGMDRRIAETLNATAQVWLSKIEGAGQHLLFSGVGRHAGLEAAGDLARLQQMHRARVRG